MNKPAAKPKRKQALTYDDGVTDAQMEQFLVDQHAEIEALLREAKDDIENGRTGPLQPLEEFLKDARRYAKRRR